MNLVKKSQFKGMIVTTTMMDNEFDFIYVPKTATL